MSFLVYAINLTPISFTKLENEYFSILYYNFQNLFDFFLFDLAINLICDSIEYCGM